MVAFIMMVALAILAFVLAAVALILWLEELFGSIVGPCVVLSLCSVLVAYLLYRFRLKGWFAALSEDLHIFSASVATLRRGYGWAVTILNCLMRQNEEESR